MFGSVVNKMATAVRRLLSPYAVGSKEPALAFDFVNGQYRTNNTTQSPTVAFNHARSGNATMVDSDGVLKWAPHNLLPYSEDFSNAAWLCDGTITTGVTDPDGGTTAATFTATANSDRLRQLAVLNTANENIAAFYIKRRTGSGGVSIYDGSSYQSVTVTEEWSLVTQTISGYNAVVLRLGFAGDAIDVAFAHAYRSDLGGMVNNPETGDSYVPTTDSARYLPRIGNHVYNGSAWVNEGLLHESESRTNLVTYSEDFTQWSEFNVSLSLDTGVIAPDGEGAAYKLVADANNANHWLLTSHNISINGYATFSCFAKSAGDGLFLRFSGHGMAGSNESPNFNLDNGTVDVGATSSTVKEAGIRDVGNGWYFCYCVLNQTSIAPFYLILDNNGTSNSDTPWLGDGTSGVYIWGAQVESGSTPSSYIPTNGSTVTRAADTITVPSASLPWPTPEYISDELVTNGTFDTDTSGWTAGDAASILSVLDGELNIENGDASPAYTEQDLSQEVGKVYAVTFTVTAPVGEHARILFAGYDSGSAWNSGTYTVFVVAQSSANLILSNSSVSGLGESTQWDNISIREINPLSVSIQMDGKMTYADDDADFYNPLFVRWYADSSNLIQTYVRTSSTRTGQFRAEQEDSGVSDSVETGYTYFSPGINVPYNIASRHGSTFINGAVDGSALTADTTPTALPDLSATDLELGYDYMGNIGKFRVWSQDLGDDGIAEATS